MCSKKPPNCYPKLAQEALIALHPPPTRYTISEWYLNANQRIRTCEDQQQLAERILAQSDLLGGIIDDATRCNKREVDKKLELKISNIKYWKEENERQKKECCLEEEALCTYKDRIMDCLNYLREHGIKICNKCIILRAGRIGIDLVNDDVENELLKETEVMYGAQSLLMSSLEQTTEQIRLLRSSKYFLDRDNEDKSNVLKIDEVCRNLQSTSLHLSIYHGVYPLDPSNITQDEWERFSISSIDKAVKIVNSARPLRVYIDTLLKQVIEDLNNQNNATNAAFRRRIEETRETKEKLEKEHREVVLKANDMVRNITRLEKSIAEHEGFMALAHTRLGHRAQRPQNELCRDEVETQLVSEVKDIRGNVSALQQLLIESQASLRYLLKTQIQLEEDINVKTNTLKIDEVDCMTLRQGVEFNSF